MKYAKLLISIVSAFLIVLLPQAANGEVFGETKNMIDKANAKGPYIGIVIPNLFAMNPLLIHPEYKSSELVIDVGEMSFMDFIRDRHFGSNESVPDVPAGVDASKEPEVSSRPPSIDVPIVGEGIGTSTGAAGFVTPERRDVGEEEVEITGVVRGIPAKAADGGVASRLRGKRRGVPPPQPPAKKRKSPRGVSTKTAKAASPVADATPTAANDEGDSLSENTYYEMSPRQAKRMKELENMDYGEFVALYNKDFQRHQAICSVASQRMAEGAISVNALMEELALQNNKCKDLRAVAKEARSRADEASEALKQVGDLKTKVSEAEAAMKIQEEDLKDARAKLAICLSELGEKKADLELERALVAELTKKVQEGDEERTGLITEVIPYACRALLDSDELGKLVGAVISLNMDAARASVLKEFGAKGLVDLSTRKDYRPDSLNKVEKAVQDYKDANFPFVEKLSADPRASYRDLLLIKPEKEPVRPSSSRFTKSAPPPLQVNPSLDIPSADDASAI